MTNAGAAGCEGRRERVILPERPTCAGCGQALAEPYAYCANCRAAYCLTCGRQHYCLPSCRANGCLPGLCVRLVRDGVLADTWGVPAEP